MATRRAALAEPAPASQPFARVGARAVSVDALAPFGRGANAPLAGRTILQIIPRLDAGGDERTTLDVTAALAETGARALVASRGGTAGEGTAGDRRRASSFPAATKNPLAMTLNAPRLSASIAAERVDLVHARARWAGLGGGRGLPQGRAAVRHFAAWRLRRAFGAEAALQFRVARGDVVIANSQFTASRDRTPLSRLARGRLSVIRPGPTSRVSRRNGRAGAAWRDVRAGWGVAAHERVVLPPARLTEWKRPADDADRAAALIKGRGLDDVRFVLAGDAAGARRYARDLDARAVARRPIDAGRARRPLPDCRRRSSARRRRRAVDRAGGVRPQRDRGCRRWGRWSSSPTRRRARNHSRAAAGAQARTGWRVPPGDAPRLPTR